MIIKYTKSYDNTLKKLKKHKEEQETLKKIMDFLNDTNSFDELIYTPLAKMYGFEGLKHQNSGFYSFNLCKNGGTIRLIVKPSEDKNIIFVYISYNHYKDFDPCNVIYYE